MYSSYIAHHGVKGMRWGVRRYQYADGSLTPAGRKRYLNDDGISIGSMRVKDLVNNARTQITGKQYVDTYLKAGTTFSRIQTTDKFEDHAFYATYKKQDIDKYLGLFGKNLSSRSEYDAKKAEKEASVSGSENDSQRAKELREKSDNLKVYQLKISAVNKLKVPSDENASDITSKLLREDKFKNDVIESIKDSKEKMRRPSQQLLFSQAEKALKKDPSKLSSSEKISIYKALNLSLTHHNSYEIAAQDRFYKELKKKGYNALLDYNDKEYSSYHAKRPMIVFDTDSVRLQSVTKADPKVVNSLYKKYTAERIAKEIPAQTIDLVAKYSGKTMSECRTYVDQKLNDYLN